VSSSAEVLERLGRYVCVRIPHTAYCYICVLIRYICVLIRYVSALTDTAIYVSSYAIRVSSYAIRVSSYAIMAFVEAQPY
jgi:hypothetical protein